MASWVIIILDFVREKGGGKLFPTQEKLAELTGFSLRSVSNYLKELRRAGWLSWEKRGMPARNFYSLLIPPYEEGRFLPNLLSKEMIMLIYGNPVMQNIAKQHMQNQEFACQVLQDVAEQEKQSSAEQVMHKIANKEYNIEEKQNKNISTSIYTPPAKEIQPKNFEEKKIDQSGGGEIFDDGKRKANKVHSKYVSPYAKRIVEVFKHHYMNKFGCPPAIYPKAIERLEEQLKFLNDGAEKAAFVDKAIEVIPNYLSSDDYFVKHKVNYSFSGFVSQLPKLLSLASSKKLTQSEEKSKKIDIGIEGVECYEGL